MLPAVLTLALALLVVGGGLFVLVTWLMARTLLMPARMVGGRALWILRRLTPEDLGLPFEEVWFDVRDEQAVALGQPEGAALRLAAWWIPARRNTGRCVIFAHGYSDSKIGSIAWVPTFRDLGYHVLAIDLRAHGESGGRHCTAGFFERHDLSQVIDQLRALRPDATRQLVLFGVSLGAAVAAATADLRQGRDLAALVLDCPYRDFASAAMTHGDVLGMPGKWFQRVAIAWAQRMSGADFAAVAPERTLLTIPCPVMVIHGADDLLITRTDMDAIEAAARARSPELGRTEYWRPDATHHVLALQTDPAEFARRIAAFLAVDPIDVAVGEAAGNRDAEARK